MGNKDNMSEAQKRKKMVALCFLAVIIFFVTFLKGGSLFSGESSKKNLMLIQEESAKEKPENVEGEIFTGAEQKEKESSETDAGEDRNTACITVDIEGAVSKPGVFVLKKDIRIYEAVSSAGGLTAEADLRDINQAEVLLDGEKLYIPSKSDYAGETGTVQGSRQNRTSDNSAKKVNLNTADSAKLQTLKGIGPSMAERILQYRAENGKFKNIEELKNVKGIGAKTFEKLRECITVT